ncbi:MAG: PAS domain-containing protein [Myxococcales bacterium]|nr:PAS domain-containing protein [Myxococcales bacterium]MCB9575481.1 PAS domain-containing protein [Polyangiaceae bacterium]
MFAAAVPRTATESDQELSLLVDVAGAVNATRSSAEALQVSLERICQFLEWPVGHALLVAPEDDRLVSVDVWHLADEQRYRSFREASAEVEFSRGGLPGAALKFKRSQLIKDVSAEPRFLRRSAALAVGLHTGLAIPILALDHVVGVIELFDTRPADLDARDITVLEHVGIILGRSVERERAQSALEERERALSEAQRIAHLGSWQWDAGSGRVEWSDELYRIHGLEPGIGPVSLDDALGYVHVQDRANVEAALRRAKDEGASFEFDERVVRPSGEIRWLHARGMPVFGSDGEPRGMMGIAIDLTERRQAEERARALMFEQLARQRSERERLRLGALFDQAPAVIAVVDADTGRYQMANAELAGLVGQSVERGTSTRELFPRSPDDVLRKAFDVATETRVPQSVSEVNLGNGRERYYNFLFQPVFRDEGETMEIMIHGAEVSELVAERRQVEDKIAELARVAAELERSNRELDQFAYIASHDLKAPLRGIANVSTWVEEDLGDAADDEIRENLRLLRDRVSRMEALIDGLLQYSRVGRFSRAPEPLDVVAICRDVAELLDPPKNVSIVVPPELPEVEAQLAPFRQVLHNLLANAIKYARVPSPRIEVGGRSNGSHVDYWVSDNGPGIAPAHQEKIWGIFQKLESRDVVDGTGIGLALVRKIVETHGGRAWVESTPGEGATFHFSWPKVSGE